MIKIIKKKVRSFLISCLSPFVQEIINTQIRVWGDPQRINISPTAQLVNTLFNTSSGLIEVGDYTFTGHNVSLITGTHQYELLLLERMLNFPTYGRDIIIGKGVWIGSNAIVLGPCKVGDNAVIAAGSVVLSGTDIPPGVIVAGIPARIIKTVTFTNQS